MTIPVSAQKTGRKAGQDQRDYAAMLVQMYEAARQSSDGRYCPNPDAPPEEQCFIEYSNPALLLDALRVFASNGTFVNRFRHSVNTMLLRDQWKHLREGGVSYEAALAQMAEEHHSTERTIERRMSTTKRGI